MTTAEVSAIAELHTLEDRRVRATTSGDIDELRSLLTEDYQHVHAMGRRTDREDTLRFVARRPREIYPRRPEIRCYGDVAVLNGEMVNRILRTDGETVEIHLEVTQVAVRDADGWRFCSFQATPHPGQPSPNAPNA